MPTYEYSCDCGVALELFVRRPPAPRSVRCECGRRARRVFSAPGLVTETSNPLREAGRNRRQSEAAMLQRGTVIGNQHDDDVCERRASVRRAELDKEVTGLVRDYHKLPAEARRLDAQRVARRRAKMLQKLKARPLVRAG